MPDVGAPSREWQLAYRSASPDPGAQTDVWSALGRRITSTDTAAQARRVSDLRQVIDGLDQPAAQRLRERLSAPNDPLGDLFWLTLHPATCQSLLTELDGVRRAGDRATAPSRRLTGDKGTPDDSAPAGRKWLPEVVKPPTKVSPPADHPPPGIVRLPWRPPPDQEPWLQWRPPGDSLVGIPEGSGWLRKALKAAGKAALLPASAVVSVLPPSVLNKAIEAAWLVIQVEEGGIPVLYGHMGEAIAQTVLSETLGIPVENLNTLFGTNNFPLIDLISSESTYSVKLFGLGWSRLDPGGTRLASAYITQIADLISGSPTAERKLKRTAQRLLSKRSTLVRQGKWPTALTSETDEGVANYLRDNILFRVPDDHAALIRSEIGRAILENRLWPARQRELGLTTPSKVVAYVNRQLSRFQGMGLSSDTLRGLIDAVGDLPPEVAKRFREDNAARLAKLGKVERRQ